MTLQGKVAQVAGSLHGIGRRIALKLAEQGATLIINYLHDEGAAYATRGSGAAGTAIRADVSRPEEVTQLMGQAQTALGALDIFVSNALGYLLGFMSPPLQVSLAQWEEAYRVQSRAFLVRVQQATPLLRDRGRTVAINYWPGSHGGGFLPYFDMGTNKAAQKAMCRYFAVALAPRGITVNALSAGITTDSIVNRLLCKLNQPCSPGCGRAETLWDGLERPQTSAGP